MDDLKLNDAICFYRKRQGLTQEELAVKLGVTNQSVSKWESAQCCPDIGLIPRLAEIFEISIDELFGKEPKPTVNNFDLCTEFPWADDEKLRVIFARGRKILQETDGINDCIKIKFPTDCNENAMQYFKVEVFGNTYCDANINGDIISHGTIECNQINGDIKECKDNITCSGGINGNVYASGNVSCADTINGSVNCGTNVTCGYSIDGDVNCGKTVATGNTINGNVKCGGNVECNTIEGNVECQGNIIYK